MIKIKDFTIERLHNEEDFGFQRCVQLETAHLTLKSDQAMVADYKAALLAYDLSLKNGSCNSHTVEVVHIDSLTDTAWRGLQTLIKVTLKHPNENCRTTASKFYTIINKYGDITNMGYNEKYGSAFNLLQDFKLLGEEKQKQISIYDWVIELQTRYDEFILASTARTEEESHRITGIIKESRNKADRAYRTLTERVNALALINAWEEYASFIININGIIDESKAVLAARKTRIKSNKKNK